MVEGEKTEDVAQHIFDEYENALKFTILMNALSNLGTSLQQVKRSNAYLILPVKMNNDPFIDDEFVPLA